MLPFEQFMGHFYTVTIYLRCGMYFGKKALKWYVSLTQLYNTIRDVVFISGRYIFSFFLQTQHAVLQLYCMCISK